MSEDNEFSNNTSNTCIVCYKIAEFFSIGICDHPVCYECSTRMRVLCQQNECPICRQDLPKVVFTKKIKSFGFFKKEDLLDLKYNIYFESSTVQIKFNKLLANYCTICKEDEVFSTFNDLNEHMRRKHELFYCDLCVDNLKIFSHERRCYSKVNLSRHRRRGDQDDKSHKGHPLCEFCNHRYMDNDELYRHLRRDHLFCHFCDADGLHHYYQSYNYLQEHFRQEHYMCEEANCADEQFTSVFRTDIDLKVHKANTHGKHLGKAGSKQARTLELEFSLTPRDNSRNCRGTTDYGSNLIYGPNNHYYRSESSVTSVLPAVNHEPLVDVQSIEEFPSLTRSTPTIIPSINYLTKDNCTIRGILTKSNYEENFPALGPECSCECAPGKNGVCRPSSSKTFNLSVSSSNKNKNVTKRTQKNATSNLSIRINHRSNGTVMAKVTRENVGNVPSTSTNVAFPVLGNQHGSQTSIRQDQFSSWEKFKNVNEAALISCSKKVAASTKNPFILPLCSGQDFPTLDKAFGVHLDEQEQIQPTSSAMKHMQSIKTSTSSPERQDVMKDKTKRKKKKKPQININSKVRISASKCNSWAKETSLSTKDSIHPKAHNQELKKKYNSNFQSNVCRINDNIGQSIIIPLSSEHEVKLDSLSVVNKNLTMEASDISNEDLISKLEEMTMPSSVKQSSDLPRPPPGFSASPAATPPPGFFCGRNELTFYNSCGDKYTIVPDEMDQFDKKSYLPLVDFQLRNKALIAAFNDCFDNESSEDLKAFRQLSGLFRAGICNAEEYYKQCRRIVGADAFRRIFPELIVLLPNIEKQRELFEVHKRENFAEPSNYAEFEACSRCGQILRKIGTDIQSHAVSHTLENHFPVLCKSNSPSNRSWIRK